MKNKPFYIRIYVDEQLMKLYSSIFECDKLYVFEELYQVVWTSNVLENRDTWIDKLFVANNLVLVSFQGKNIGNYLNVEFEAQ